MIIIHLKRITINTLDVSYLLYPDLSSNDPSYNINTLCRQLLDTSIYSTINEENKDIFIQNNLLTETNKKIHLDVIKPIVKYMIALLVF